MPLEEADTVELDELKRRLISQHPFWGTCACHLNWKEDRKIPTGWTDGTHLALNPEHLASLTMLERLSLAAHEIDHVVKRHPWRRGNRDPFKWNEACDFQVNADLKEAGFVIPASWLYDPQYAGKSAEWIYSAREAEQQHSPEEPQKPSDESGDDESQQDDSGDSGDEGGDSGDDSSQPRDDGEPDNGDGESGEGDGPGELVMPDSPSGEFADGAVTSGEEGDQLTEQDWESIAEAAMLVASQAGKMPGGEAQSLKAAREPRVAWKDEVREFVTHSIPSFRSFSRPNRRFIHKGLYLPGPVKNNVGPIVLIIDTSGSTYHIRQQFAEEIDGFMREVAPEKLVVVYIDTEVQGVDEFLPGDEVKIDMRGGGGTLSQPAFDYIEQERLDPMAAFYLTDLELGDVPQEPGYPVMWVTPLHSDYEAPFGRLVKIP